MPTKQAFPLAPSRKVFGHPQRVGLYARVSTHDQQTLPLQIRALREYTIKRGWMIVVQIKEVGSGASQRELRQTLLAAARRREIDVVMVWRLDRWGRSVADLVSTLQELQHLGVGFVSLTEALDLTTPAGRAMAGLLAVFAEFEREILRERSASWSGPRAREGEALGATANGGAPRQPGVEAISRRRQQGRDRPPVQDRADLSTPDFGLTSSRRNRAFPKAPLSVTRPSEPAPKWLWMLLQPNPLLWRAIEDRRMIRLLYHRRNRILEPHDHGILNGSVQLLAYQVGGSSSRPLPNWILMKANEIADIELLDQFFPGGRPTASGKHLKWNKLFIK
jgi:putative DNA-invertase from lambdoid prophage Rac